MSDLLLSESEYRIMDIIWDNAPVESWINTEPASAGSNVIWVATRTDNSHIEMKMEMNPPMEYPYEGSKTLMHVFDRFEDKELIQELLDGMYTELPAPKKKK